MSKIEPYMVADVIGWYQRRAFERSGDMYHGTTLDEIASDLSVSISTARHHLNEARRRWVILDGPRPVKRCGRTGAKLGGRREMEFWIRDGHLWNGAGKPLAAAVGVGVQVP